MNNKTASEMFKALGYIPFFTTDRIMAYTNISNIENEEDEGYVFFYLKTKCVKTCYSMQIDGVRVDMKLLTAINKQCEEYGWLDV